MLTDENGEPIEDATPIAYTFTIPSYQQATRFTLDSQFMGIATWQFADPENSSIAVYAIKGIDSDGEGQPNYSATKAEIEYAYEGSGEFSYDYLIIAKEPVTEDVTIDLLF